MTRAIFAIAIPLLIAITPPPTTVAPFPLSQSYCHHHHHHHYRHTRIVIWVLCIAAAVLTAIYIAPESPYFVGNVMIFILASVLG
jgi:hypothetical protein